ncbi:MAG: hypothetical protein NT169_00010 [Chloroflexi bacterium]|nr:hypothetical protein [Chloroflexota bacterium]
MRQLKKIGLYALALLLVGCALIGIRSLGADAGKQSGIDSARRAVVPTRAANGPAPLLLPATGARDASGAPVDAHAAPPRAVETPATDPGKAVAPVTAPAVQQAVGGEPDKAPAPVKPVASQGQPPAQPKALDRAPSTPQPAAGTGRQPARAQYPGPVVPVQ